MMKLPSGLYGFADTFYGDPIEQGLALAQAGCPTIQLRAKGWEIAQIEQVAHALANALKEYGTCFIINDHVGVAADCGAHGVHLGQDDGDIRAARSQLGPHCLIGRSTHSLSQIQDVEDVDYIGFGPIFQTETKVTENPEIGIPILAKAVDISPVPVVAIGGITAKHLPDLLGTGVHAWAVIRELAQAENIREAVKHLHPST
jgi:thiamine-phosphate pyrophosphorylase